MIQINEKVQVNENNITQLVKVEDKCYVILSSGEKLQISQETFEELGGEI